MSLIRVTLSPSKNNTPGGVGVDVGVFVWVGVGFPGVLVGVGEIVFAGVSVFIGVSEGPNNYPGRKVGMITTLA